MMMVKLALYDGRFNEIYSVTFDKVTYYRIRVSTDNVVAPQVSGTAIAQTLTKYVEGDFRCIIDNQASINQVQAFIERLMNMAMPTFGVTLYSGNTVVHSNYCVLSNLEWSIDSSAPTIYQLSVSFVVGRMGGK